jgi:hypothetical protein
MALTMKSFEAFLLAQDVQVKTMESVEFEFQLSQVENQQERAEHPFSALAATSQWQEKLIRDEGARKKLARREEEEFLQDDGDLGDGYNTHHDAFVNTLDRQQHLRKKTSRKESLRKASREESRRNASKRKGQGKTQALQCKQQETEVYPPYQSVIEAHELSLREWAQEQDEQLSYEADMEKERCKMAAILASIKPACHQAFDETDFV